MDVDKIKKIICVKDDEKVTVLWILCCCCCDYLSLNSIYLKRHLYIILFLCLLSRSCAHFLIFNRFQWISKYLSAWLNNNTHVCVKVKCTFFSLSLFESLLKEVKEGKSISDSACWLCGYDYEDNNAAATRCGDVENNNEFKKKKCN